MTAAYADRSDPMLLLHDLLHIAFEGSPPPSVRALLPPAPALDRFAAAPIFTFGGGARAYVARVDDPGFLSRVMSAFPDPVVGRFFRSAPEARWMIDTDGRQATAYLDDLQQHPHLAAGPHGLTAMCATLSTPEHVRSYITRHESPPRQHLNEAWVARLDRATQAGLHGLWGVRWQGDEVTGLLCVNEDRWQGGDVEAAGAWLDRFNERRWLAARARCHEAGWVAYPDAIELRPDGRWDVTLGLLRG